MRYMNDYDIDFAVSRLVWANQPNRLSLALLVRNLAEQTNLVSDGWAYWAKPARAAAKAIALIESTNREQEERDLTEREVAEAVRPIKAFLTRHSSVYTADQRERILRSVI